MDNEYKISLGVKVDTSDIQSQINKAISNTQFKKLRIELNKKKVDSQLNSIRKQIQNLSNIKVNLNINPIGNGKNKNNPININGGSSQSPFGKQFNNSLSSANIVVRNTKKNIEDLKKQLGKFNFDKSTINRIVKDFNKMNLSISEVVSTINEKGKVSISVKGIDEYQRAVNVIKEIDTLTGTENTIKKISQSFETTADASKRLSKELVDISNKMGSLEVKIKSLETNGGSKNQIKALKRELRGLQKEYNSVVNSMNAPIDSNYQKTLDAQFANTSNRLKELDAKYADTRANLAKDIKLKVDTKSFDKDLDVIEARVKKLGNIPNDLRRSITQLKSNKTQIQNSILSGNQDGAINAYDRYNKYKSTIFNQLGISENAQKDIDDTFNKLRKAENEARSLEQRIATLDKKADFIEIDTLNDQLNEAVKRAQRLRAQLSGKLTNKQEGLLSIDEKDAKNKLEQIEARLESSRNKIKEKTKEQIKFKIDTKEFEKDISDIDAAAKKLGKIPDDLKRSIAALKGHRTNIEKSLYSGQDDTAIRRYDSYAKLKTSIGNRLGITANDRKSIDQDFNKLKNLASYVDSLNKKIAKIDPKINVEQFNVLTKELNGAEKAYTKLYNKLNGKLSSGQLNSLSEDARRAQVELDELKAKIDDTKRKLANSIKAKIVDGTFDNDLSNVSTKFDNLSNKSKTTKIAIDQLSKSLGKMRNAEKTGNNDELIKSYQEYEKTLKNVNNQLAINKRAEQSAAAKTALAQSKDQLSLDMSNWLKENSAAAKQFGGRIKELQAQIKSCDKTGLANLRAEFTKIKKEAQLAGKTTQTFADRLKTQFSKYSSYLSVASLFMYATQGLRDMFRQVVAIDTAMTELKKVTDETSDTYNEFLTNAAKRSKEIGTTIDGLVTSTADFARLGYSFIDSQGLAEVANIYTVVGDEIEGIEDATQSLISTLAAFKDEANGLGNSEFAMSIVDKMNEVSNNFAISSGGIGEALKRSASSMAAANNSLDETIALITAANTVAQNPEKVGNAFKTMSMRIRAAKSELEDAGESTEGMAESTASLRAEIMALSGVDIMLND